MNSSSHRLFPRISVVTPSFNQGPYLERTISSVLDQNYPNLEYLIIDGGSTDESVEIIKRYERHLTYWVSEPDSGQSNAINKGLARTTGTILAWLNSDDFYLPGTFRTIAEAAVAHPESGAFVGEGQIVDTSGTVLNSVKPQPAIVLETLFNWMSGGDFLQPSCFFRDSAWRATGPLDESIHIAFDVDFWIRMVKAGCSFRTIDSLLSQALLHATAKTTAYTNLMRVDCAMVTIRHGGEHAVRKHLDDMAMRLSWAEANLGKIMNNPVVRLLAPLVRLFVQPAARRQDVVPRWLKR